MKVLISATAGTCLLTNSTGEMASLVAWRALAREALVCIMRAFSSGVWPCLPFLSVSAVGGEKCISCALRAVIWQKPMMAWWPAHRKSAGLLPQLSCRRYRMAYLCEKYLLMRAAFRPKVIACDCKQNVVLALAAACALWRRTCSAYLHYSYRQQ